LTRLALQRLTSLFEILRHPICPSLLLKTRTNTDTHTNTRTHKLAYACTRAQTHACNHSVHTRTHASACAHTHIQANAGTLGKMLAHKRF